MRVIVHRSVAYDVTVKKKEGSEKGHGGCQGKEWKEEMFGV